MELSFGIEDIGAMVGIPTKTLPYEESEYGMEVAMWFMYELASAPFCGRFFWRCD
jgi:hypothetical protein